MSLKEIGDDCMGGFNEGKLRKKRHFFRRARGMPGDAGGLLQYLSSPEASLEDPPPSVTDVCHQPHFHQAAFQKANTLFFPLENCFGGKCILPP